jgi:MoaA/NifB/PqqE/SkfB family radical SAM enzyme
MKIHSKYLDINYEAQPDCQSMEIKVGSHSQSFGVLHGGIRIICMTLPNELVGQDLPVEIKVDGYADVGRIWSRKDRHDVFGMGTCRDASNKTKQSASHDAISIQWFTTWKCNFSCHYCWQETVRDSYRKERPAQVTPDDWVTALLRLNPEELYLTGGEPTTLPGITEIVSKVGSVVPINMTSNLGRSFVLKKWFDQVPAESIECITFSFHPTQIDMETYSAKLKDYVNHYGAEKAGMELVMHPNQYSYEEPVRELAKKLGIEVLNIDVFHKQPTIYPPQSASTCHMDPVYGDRIDLLPRYGPDTIPYYCSAGMKRINVDPLGDAYTCMSAIDRSKMFGKHALPHYRPIGNVFDEGFKMQTEPTLCWETFRCSGCDSAKVSHTWNKHDYLHELPLPQ